MRKIISISLALLLLVIGLVGAGVANAGEPNAVDGPAPASTPPPPGPTSQWYHILFNAPTDNFTFYVGKAQKAGDLTVETLDYGPDDWWRVDLNPAQPKNKDTFAIGDGSSQHWSGAATVHPWVRGTVMLSYDHGCNIWPASVWVRFTYSQPSQSNTGMNITPQFILPSQIPPFFSP